MKTLSGKEALTPNVLGQLPMIEVTVPETAWIAGKLLTLSWPCCATLTVDAIETGKVTPVPGATASDPVVVTNVEPVTPI